MGKSITDFCLQSRPLASIWPSTSFRFTALMLGGALWSPRRSGATNFWSSSLRCPPCLVGLEACGSAHHWARELIRLGHDARMMPPSYVKPYIRRQKNDASDAAAICEAATRPSMRFVGERAAASAAASSPMPSTTPPASVLCARAACSALITTGNPIEAAASPTAPNRSTRPSGTLRPCAASAAFALRSSSSWALLSSGRGTKASGRGAPLSKRKCGAAQSGPVGRDAAPLLPWQRCGECIVSERARFQPSRRRSDRAAKRNHSLRIEM